jgi:hypothetical protein
VFVLWGSHERWYEGVASLTSSTQRSVHFCHARGFGVTVNHANHSKVLRVILEHSERAGALRTSFRTHTYCAWRCFQCSAEPCGKLAKHRL